MKKTRPIRLRYDRKTGRLLFTKQMKKEYTILFPMMAPIHFTILQRVFNSYGYKAELLTTTSPEIAQTGLKYIHNDTCYPAILSLGQLINALQSGKYDLDRVALMITQTGGGCRASNYIYLLRKGLKKAGLERIPVVSVNLSGMEKNPGFHITLKMIRKALAAIIYGDMLMCLSNQAEPYEAEAGTVKSTVDRWTERLVALMSRGRGYRLREIKNLLDEIAADFAAIELRKTKKVKVGIVGEIYVKYAALGNNELERFLKDEGCEVNLPGMLNFLMFKIDNRIEDVDLYGGSALKKRVCTVLLDYCRDIQGAFNYAIAHHSSFAVPASYDRIKELVRGVNGYGNKMGEGWLLTGEMLELADSGYENIVCTQPFGCLPNHISGKGMIRKIREINPKANIVAVDYDAGAPRVNQENRIKLMLSIAKENLEADEEKNGAPTAQEA